MATHIIPNDPDATARLEVHWQRGTGVQLATSRYDGDQAAADAAEAFRHLQAAKETGVLPDIERAEREYANADQRLTGGEGGWFGQFVDLDRTQINHLIKQLRVARDQAFGRDA